MCIFFELWTSTIVSLRLDPQSTFRVGLSVLSFVGGALESIASLGFGGACVIALGRQRGLNLPVSFAPGGWLKDLTLESLKALFFACLWLLALVIPGIIRWAQFGFIPMIVIWEPEYRAGRVNALKSSLKLAKGQLPTLLLLPALLVGEAFLYSEYPAIGGSVFGFALSRLMIFYLNLLVLVTIGNRYLQIREKFS